jgi:hypothetical protein
MSYDKLSEVIISSELHMIITDNSWTYDKDDIHELHMIINDNSWTT